MAKKRTIYRDSNTGHFVSKAKYTRSHAHGGTRYRAQKIEVRLRERKMERHEPSSGSINSLQDYYDYEDFDYQEYEFETGLDYGESD